MVAIDIWPVDADHRRSNALPNTEPCSLAAAKIRDAPNGKDRRQFSDDHPSRRYREGSEVLVEIIAVLVHQKPRDRMLNRRRPCSVGLCQSGARPAASHQRWCTDRYLS